MRHGLSLGASFFALVLLVACGGGSGSGSGDGGGTPPPPTHQFFVSGNLAAARSAHAAALLSNGKVLVCGGSNSSGALNSAEVFDPASQTFTPSGLMSVARVYPTATPLSNGLVLVVGTEQETTVELFDPTSALFHVTGNIGEARREHTATLLSNGKVLIAGGFGTAAGIRQTTASVELYDPASGTFSSIGALSSARQDHTAATLSNGKVLLVGGRTFVQSTGTSVALAGAELYDPTANTFSVAGSMSTPRFFHTATVLQDGRVLVVGGLDVNGQPQSSAEVYNPSTNTFSLVGSMLQPRYLHTASLLSDGTVLIAGGITSITGTVGNFVDTAETFDPTTNTFHQAASMTVARAGHTATVLQNGQVLVTAGQTTGGVALNTSEIFK